VGGRFTPLAPAWAGAPPLNLDVMRHLKVFARLATILSAALAARALGCSPIDTNPTVQKEYEHSEHVYLAQLVMLSSVRTQWVYRFEEATETAIFKVLKTLKGRAPTGGMFLTRTTFNGANCRLSLVNYGFGYDTYGLGSSSDVWVLFLSGQQPYNLIDIGKNHRASYFGEDELVFLFAKSKRP
jgi:hypothetical protein